jgi:GDP-L-fucose synthase
VEKVAKIYVAGHTGLVGSAIMRKLKTDGYRNIITEDHTKLDLRRQDLVEKFFSKKCPEYVFLAAAKVGGILANSTYKAEFIYDNTMIAFNVINTAYKHGVIRLLNLGSSCIYPKSAPQPLKEEYLLTGSLEPTNEPYAIAKISAIKLCQYYNEQHGTNFISVMPTNVYGPNDNYNLETSHALPALIRKFHEAKEKSQPFVTVWGTGEPYREFLYVDDLADAIVFLMKKHPYKNIGPLVNIGVGEDIKIKNLVILIKKFVKFSGKIIYDTSKPDGTPKKLLDVSHVKKLGWMPKVGLEEGIKKTYTLYCQKSLTKRAKEKVCMGVESVEW